MQPQGLLWRFGRGVVLALLAAVIFVEEFGWRPLAAWLALWTRWPPLQRLESRIRQLPPKAAIAVFLVPVVLLFPLKLIALGMIHAGHAAAGVALIVAAKLLGTALVGRLFVLLEPQLRQFPWFVRALDWWQSVKCAVRSAVESSSAWQRAQRAIRHARLWWRRRVSR